jgi:hypothetical protein
MAQQAVPNGMGHNEPFRAQLATSLTVVVMMLSPTLLSTAIRYSLSVLSTIAVCRVSIMLILKAYRQAVDESNYARQKRRAYRSNI